MANKADPIKTRLRSVTEGIISAVKAHGPTEKLQPVVETLVKEAYDLGLLVGKGKLPAPTDEPV